MSKVKSNEDVAANIAANVARLLLASGLSQRKLANKTGDPHMTIVHAINGDYIPNSGILARIAEALGVTADALIGDPPGRRRKSRKTA
jgi:transcriptional regulator with XRE-family HTH domain